MNVLGGALDPAVHVGHAHDADRTAEREPDAEGGQHGDDSDPHSRSRSKNRAHTIVPR